MAKKKIAILTQPIKANYGGIIQNYGLSEFLKKHGYQVKTINRVEKNPNSKLKILSSNFKRYFVSYFIKKNALNPTKERKIFKNQSNFIQNHIDLTSKIDNSFTLKNHFKKEHYDTVIVGSDQTWRPKYSPNIYNYFLDFLKDNNQITKLAYATSFGTSDWEFSEEETKHCAKLVQQFDAVSVREESAVEMTTKYLNKDSVWVVDPTMLLEKSDYLKLIDKRRQPQRKGIYSYILDETSAIRNFIEQAQDILQMAHFTNQPKVRDKSKTSKKLSDYKYPALEGWLQGFEEADFVITNSFHGTVFCVIFNKPFITIVNKERGASRFYSLLGKLNLDSRIIETTSLSKKQMEDTIHQKVDFTHANQTLKEMKKESVEFLLKALEKN
jgi:exopolysaccharide biosynthesis predicted pyruvyltransferase EpsI